MRGIVRIMLREYIRLVIAEAGFEPNGPKVRNALSPDVQLDRDSMGAISKTQADCEDPGLVDHLQDADIENDDDVFGPVPPDSDPVHISLDPFVRGHDPDIRIG